MMLPLDHYIPITINVFVFMNTLQNSVDNQHIFVTVQSNMYDSYVHNVTIFYDITIVDA